MGLYSQQILPRVLNKVCASAVTMPLRERVCAGLSGHVVELGFGSGLNVPFYPRAVLGVAAIEPSDVSWKLAAPRVAASAIPVERAGLDGQSLSLPDNSCDCALSTWTLCTVPNAVAALAELRRVLKPGGRFHFLEHGLAPDERVRRWQYRLEPLQKRLVGGCHLTRSIVELVTSAGFSVVHVETFYEEGGPKALGADSLGVAVAS